MRPEVREQFPSFTARYEGRIPWMYVDVKGLVTIGLGCLIDPVGMATSLSFAHLDGSPADANAISAEWRVIKHTPGLPQRGAGAAKALCRLRLPEAAIDDLARVRLDANERILRGFFPEWDSWPGEAQLGVLSMAWAMGAGFPRAWPVFAAACAARDWVTASQNCRMREDGNPGVVPRNAMNAKLFATAALPLNAPVVQGVTDEDRARVDRLLAVWFDEQLHGAAEEPSA